MFYVLVAGGVALMFAGFAVSVVLFILLCDRFFGRIGPLHVMLFLLMLVGTVGVDLAQAAVYADQQQRLHEHGDWTDSQWQDTFTIAAAGGWVAISCFGLLGCALMTVPGLIPECNRDPQQHD